MLNDRDIIVFSDDWGRHPSSCQHLIGQLLPTNRVVWVNTIGMRSPQISIYDIKRCFEVAAGWCSKAPETERCQLHPNLTVTSPVMIPYNQFTLIRRFNRSSVKRSVGSLIEKRGMKKPLVITTFPCTCDYVGTLGESLHVYYCVDDFVNWPDVDLELIRSMEDLLIDRSGLVLASAEALCDAKQRGGKRPLLLPHGVDFEHFNAACGKTERPVELKGIPQPIIGFFGAISAWVDLDLLVELATLRPQWSFVLIGPVDTDASVLQGVPNIHLPGKVPYARLPEYAACFDVGIIPFQVNDLTKSVNPLKLFEYLALGLPVVSSFMPEVAKYRDLIAIAGNRSEFLACLDEALAGNTAQLRQKRIDAARSNSWRAVAERFSAMVNVAEGEGAVSHDHGTRS